eukprot:TRINITY_DN1424_c1_g1_i6.p1 TRINITY_DN1424_c1_g1~~TRINITY_DN1424_c1_g1_i6.p1  ORF type:complete len:1042 (+),score=434.80 TRINITY_DN1424_c1_g1_i6:67-3192(+)
MDWLSGLAAGGQGQGGRATPPTQALGNDAPAGQGAKTINLAQMQRLELLNFAKDHVMLVRDLKKQLKERDASVQEKDKALAALEAKVADSDAVTAAAWERVERLEAAAATAAAVPAAPEAKKDQPFDPFMPSPAELAQAEVKQKAEQIAALQAEVAEKNNKMQEWQVKVRETIQSYETRVATLRQENAVLTASAGAANGGGGGEELAALKSERDQLKQQTAYLQGQLFSEEERAGAVQDELREAKEAMLVLQEGGAELALLRDENAQLKAQLEALADPTRSGSRSPASCAGLEVEELQRVANEATLAKKEAEVEAQALKGDVVQLEGQLDTVREEAAAAETSHEAALEALRQELQVMIQKAGEAASLLRSEAAAATTEKTELAEKLALSEVALAHVDEEKASLQQQLATAKAEHDAAAQAAAAQLAAVELGLGSTDDRESTIAALRDDLAALNDDLLSMKEAKAEASERLAELQAARDDAETARSALASRLEADTAAAAASAADLQQKLDALAAEKVAAEEAKSAADAELAALQDSQDGASAVAAELQQKLDALTAEKAAVEEARSAANTELAALRDANEASASSAAAAAGVLQQQLDALAAEKAAADAELSALREEKATTVADAEAGDELRQRYDALAAEKAAVEEAKDAELLVLRNEMQQQVEALTAEKAAAEEAQTASAAELAALREVQGTSSSATAELQHRLDALVQQKATVEGLHAEATAALQAELVAAQADAAQLRTELHDGGALGAKLAASEADKQTLEAAVAVFKQQVAEQSAALSVKSEDLVHVTTDYETLKAQQVELHAELLRLNDENTALKANSADGSAAAEQVRQLTEALDARAAEKAVVEAELASVREMAQLAENSDMQVAGARAAGSAPSAELAQLREEKAAMEQKTVQWKEKVREIVGQKEGVIQGLQAQLRGTEDDVLAAGEAIEKLTKEVDELKHTLQATLEDKAQYERELEDMILEERQAELEARERVVQAEVEKRVAVALKSAHAPAVPAPAAAAPPAFAAPSPPPAAEPITDDLLASLFDM